MGRRDGNETAQNVEEDNKEERREGAMGRMCFPSAPSGAAFHLRHPEGHTHTHTPTRHFLTCLSHTMRSSRVNSLKILIRTMLNVATLT